MSPRQLPVCRESGSVSFPNLSNCPMGSDLPCPEGRFERGQEYRPHSDTSPANSEKHSCPPVGGRDTPALGLASSWAKGQGAGSWLLATRKVFSAFSFQTPGEECPYLKALQQLWAGGPQNQAEYFPRPLPPNRNPSPQLPWKWLTFPLLSNQTPVWQMSRVPQGWARLH